MKLTRSLLVMVTMAVVCVGGLFSVAGFFLIQREARQQINELAEAQALGFSQMLAGTIEGALRNGQLLEARAQVLRMPLSPLVRSAHLLDDELSILYSTDLERVGDPFAAAILPALKSQLEQARRRAVSLARIDSATGAIWIAVPIRLPPTQNELISSRRGMFLVAYDFMAWDAVAQDYSTRNFQAAVGLIMAVSIGLLGFLWLLVTRRIRRMTDAAEAMAVGNLKHPVNVQGQDEIGRLAAAFRSLTAQLSETIFNLSASDNRLRSIMDSASDAILLVGSDGTVISANSSADTFFGKLADASDNVSSLLSAGSDVTFMEFALSEADKIGQGLMGGSRVEFHARSSDGTETPVEVSIGQIPAAEGHRFVFIVRDISERQELEHQIRYMQRMDAVGQLTAGVAHDFNNLLAVAMGNYELLLDTGLDEDQSELAQSGIEACVRGANLSRQLLMFGRQAELRSEVLDINSVVSGMRKLLLRTVPESINVETSLSGRAWPSLLDRTQLESAILNLAINAKDAMPNGGDLTIETENVRLDSEYAMNHRLEVSPGPYVMVAVTDTGEGIPAEGIERVFDPFFTTKPVGQGSGMGLAMVFGFVKQSGGNVTIYSEPGVGTTVKLYFPRTDKVALKVETVVAEPNVSLLQETILLVEDDENVRKTVAAQLEALSYRVVIALNGDDAVRQIDGGAAFDLMLTDVVMTGSVQGPELAKRVLREIPGKPIILMSGYPKGATENGNGELAHLNMLTKPIRKQDLAHAVRRVIAGKGN